MEGSRRKQFSVEQQHIDTPSFCSMLIRWSKKKRSSIISSFEKSSKNFKKIGLSVVFLWLTENNCAFCLLRAQNFT